MEPDERDRLAFELIETAAWALKALNGNSAPFPISWKKQITKSFVLDKGGHPPATEVQKRNIEIASKVFDYSVSLVQWKAADRPDKKRMLLKRYVEQLLTEYGLSESTQIFKILKDCRHEAARDYLRKSASLMFLVLALPELSKKVPPEILDFLKNYSGTTVIESIEDWVKTGQKHRLSQVQEDALIQSFLDLVS